MSYRPSGRNPRQLQQVVGGADQALLSARLIKAPQQHLPERATVFDLADHRLDDDLAQAVTAAPTAVAQPCPI